MDTPDRVLLLADAREALASHGCDYACKCPARLAYVRFKFLTGVLSGPDDRYDPPAPEPQAA